MLKILDNLSEHPHDRVREAALRVSVTIDLAYVSSAYAPFTIFIVSGWSPVNLMVSV